MDPTERATLIRQYEAAADEVRAAVDGLSDAELDRRPADDPDHGWTARQVVHHLADSEMTSAIRLRKLLAEDDAVIVGYDEEAFARRLHYDARPIGPSLDAMAAARATTAQLLGLLSEDDWARTGTHTESGPYSVEDWLRIYAAHGHDHAAQIRHALAT
jgi:hypothetical protein